MTRLHNGRDRRAAADAAIAVAEQRLADVLKASLGSECLVLEPDPAAARTRPQAVTRVEVADVILHPALIEVAGHLTDARDARNRGELIAATKAAKAGITRAEIWLTQRQLDAVLRQTGQRVGAAIERQLPLGIALAGQRLPVTDAATMTVAALRRLIEAGPPWSARTTRVLNDATGALTNSTRLLTHDEPAPDRVRRLEQAVHHVDQHADLLTDHLADQPTLRTRTDPESSRRRVSHIGDPLTAHEQVRRAGALLARRIEALRLEPPPPKLASAWEPGTSIVDAWATLSHAPLRSAAAARATAPASGIDAKDIEAIRVARRALGEAVNAVCERLDWPGASVHADRVIALIGVENPTGAASEVPDEDPGLEPIAPPHDPTGVSTSPSREPDQDPSVG